MINERKLTERELESRESVLKGLLSNKRNLVKKYGKDAEKVMYGIATKKAKSKMFDTFQHQSVVNVHCCFGLDQDIPVIRCGKSGGILAPSSQKNKRL